MFKNIYLFIVLVSFSTFLGMEDSSKNESPTKFEEFVKLPEDLQKLVFTIAVQSGDLKEAIENIKKFVLLNKKWEQYFNNPQALNQLAELLSEKAQIFFNPLFKQANLGDFNALIQTNPREFFENEKRLKIIVLSLLGTKEALSALDKKDPNIVTTDFINLIDLTDPRSNIQKNNTLAWAVVNVIKTLKNLYKEQWIAQAIDREEYPYYLYKFMQNFKQQYPAEYFTLIELGILQDFQREIVSLPNEAFMIYFGNNSVTNILNGLKP